MNHKKAHVSNNLSQTAFTKIFLWTFQMEIRRVISALSILPVVVACCFTVSIG